MAVKDKMQLKLYSPNPKQNLLIYFGFLISFWFSVILDSHLTLPYTFH